MIPPELDMKFVPVSLTAIQAVATRPIAYLRALGMPVIQSIINPDLLTVDNEIMTPTEARDLAILLICHRGILPEGFSTAEKRTVVAFSVSRNLPGDIIEVTKHVAIGEPSWYTPKVAESETFSGHVSLCDHLLEILGTDRWTRA